MHGDLVTRARKDSLLAGRSMVAHTLKLLPAEASTMMVQRSRILTYLCMNLSRYLRVCVAVRGHRIQKTAAE